MPQQKNKFIDLDCYYNFREKFLSNNFKSLNFSFDVDTKLDSGIFITLFKSNSESNSLRKLNGFDCYYVDIDEQKHACLKCSSEEFLDLYLKIINSVIEEIINNEVYEFEDSFNAVVERWRIFIESPPLEYLSEEKVIGLYGELLFLKKIAQFSPEKAIECWSANSSRDKSVDFKFSNDYFEIKSTLKNVHTHRINGLKQLEVIESINKFLVSIRLKFDSGDNGLSLASLVNQCLDLLGSEKLIYAYLKSLKKFGYDMRDEDHYFNSIFECIDAKVFKVDSYFPKITELSVKNNLERIHKVSYNIDLEGFHSVELENFSYDFLIK